MSAPLWRRALDARETGLWWRAEVHAFLDELLSHTPVDRAAREAMYRELDSRPVTASPRRKAHR